MAMKRLTPLFFLLFLALPAPLRASELVFPLLCQPGQSCWIIGYPDLNSAEGVAQDYACGPAAQDGDVFLRIGLPDAASISLHIPVVAAADGTVVDVTDGIPDLAIASRRQLKTGTPNCGNGVVIKHGGGVQTAYCHLREGRVFVKNGQKVRQGDIIGMAGQSGLATWPQLGFAVRTSGYFIDPVTGSSPQEGCGFKPRTRFDLPTQFVSYQPAAIVSMGFANRAMTGDAMALGDATRFAVLNRDEGVINLWGMVLGIHPGDIIESRIRDPRGRTFFYERVVAETAQERLPINAGRARGYAAWRTGTYTGEITVTRRVQNRDESVSRRVTLKVE